MKSFLAVLAGLVVTIVLSVGVDVLLVSTGLLAPAKPMNHALITGGIGMLNGDTPHFLAKGAAAK